MKRGERTRRRIGVLGGMGPEATVLLMDRVIAMTEALDDSDHVAMIVDNNTQVPSRIKAIIEKTGEDPGPVLVAMALRLEANGAEALALPCNTAHHYAPAIIQATRTPFLNMVELASEKLANLELTNGRVGILASPAVQMTSVFDKALSTHRIKTIYPADQDKMLDIIRSVKMNSDDASARQIMKNAAQELMENGADILLIACSELSLIADAISKSYQRIDTIDVLAEAIIRFAGAKLRCPAQKTVLRIEIA